MTKGAGAQEESMCRVSTLYAAIGDKETAGEFYERHRQMIQNREMSRKNRDDCIFTPGIKVIREDTFDCAMMAKDQWYNVDVITCAAPDLRYGGDNTYHPSESELTAVSVAALNKPDVLILGAFGCGAFYNPPEIVAQAFSNMFGEFESFFEVVEFAIFSQNEYDRNYLVFSGMKGVRKYTL